MDFATRSRVCFEPNADVFIDEARGVLVVTVEAAGADPESLRVSLEERHLLVSGRRPLGERVREGSFVQKEIAHGEFAKRIHLPVAVEHERAAATFSEGILSVTLEIARTPYRRTARMEVRMTIKRVPV